jgi:prefoldin subunit 5
VASITVSVPQGFPIGTELGAYVDRVGDIIPQGSPVSTATVQADSTVTVTGLEVGIPYQVGAVIGAQWRSFLVQLPNDVPASLNEVIADLQEHKVDETDVHGVVNTEDLATAADLATQDAAQTAALNAATTVLGDAIDDLEASMSVLPANVQTVNYALEPTDAGGVVEIDSASSRQVNVSAGMFSPGHVVEIARIGAGTVTINPGAGVYINGAEDPIEIGNQYGTVSLRFRAHADVHAVGDIA